MSGRRGCLVPEAPHRAAGESCTSAENRPYLFSMSKTKTCPQRGQGFPNELIFLKRTVLILEQSWGEGKEKAVLTLHRLERSTLRATRALS